VNNDPICECGDLLSDHKYDDVADSCTKCSCAHFKEDASIKFDPILQFFAYGHLPPHLQAVSQPFCDLAYTLVESLPANTERDAAFRKLLEAKDAAVRAKLYVTKQ